jgi:hypothetical protein
LWPRFDRNLQERIRRERQGIGFTKILMIAYCEADLLN